MPMQILYLLLYRYIYAISIRYLPVSQRRVV